MKKMFITMNAEGGKARTLEFKQAGDRIKM